MRWRLGINATVGGGDDHGRSNDYEIIRTLDALDKTIQGLPKAIEASLQVKGVYHAKNLADGAKLTAERDEFEKQIVTSKTGIIATN